MSEENELPEGWERTSIGSIAEINPAIDISALPDTTFASFIPMAAVEAETGNVDTSNQRLLREVRKGHTAFQEDDIIFAKITPCMENGKFAIARSLISGIGFGSTEFHVIRPEKGIATEFLYYYLSRSLFRQLARKAMTGSAGQLRVPASFLIDSSFPLPPTNEQQRIVESIEEQFSLLDDSAASLQKDLIRLKRARESVLKFAVEGKITEEWREENPVAETGSELLARILVERRAKWEAEELEKMRARGIVPKDERWKEKYKVPQTPDVRQLSTLPEGWCWATVDQIAVLVTDGDHNPPARVSSGVPHLTAKNIVGSLIDFSSCTFISEIDAKRVFRRYMPLPNDLIITCVGTIGRTAIVPDGVIFSPDRNLAAVRTILGYSFPKFLEYCFLSPELQKKMAKVSSSTAQPHLYLTDLRALCFPLPSLAEQEQIVNEVEMQLSIIAHTEASIEANLKRIENTRQLILEQAFAGELVEQDPDDEPASVLLERIRAERKQREQEEEKRRKEERMNGANKGRARRSTKRERRPLQQVLIEAEKPLTPDDLFHQAGLKADVANNITGSDVADNVADFFEELRDEVVNKKRIKVDRPDNTLVFLEAVNNENQ
ncbi:MAG TPA: restriction endonuclease subunit S [Ktedonobacteraceae bacterium]|nr:restriction endonuclease subunit S [Ktedonobacteraceae bacterium]